MKEFSANNAIDAAIQRNQANRIDASNSINNAIQRNQSSQLQASEAINNSIANNLRDQSQASAGINNAIARNQQARGNIIAPPQSVSEEKASRLETRARDKEALLNNTAENKRLVLARSREAKEVITDTGKGLALGTIALGETAYALGNLATGGAIDEMVTEARDGKSLYTSAAELKEEISDTYSDPSKQASQRVQEELAVLDAQVEADYGDSPWKREAFNAWNALKTYGGEPSVLYDEFVKSVPQMIGTGGVGGLAAKGATKSITTKAIANASERKIYGAARNSMVNKQLKDAVPAARVKAGALSIGAVEGSSTANEIANEILTTSFTDLEDGVPKFVKIRNQFIKEGLTKAQANIKARRSLANNGQLIGGLLSAVTSAVAAKVSGAAQLETNLFKMNSRFGKGLLGKAKNTVDKTLRGATAESIEEGIQGGVGTAAGNIARQQTINPDQDLLEGTGTGAGQGIAVGAASGGALSGGVGALDTTLSTVATGVSKTAQGVSKVAKKFAADGKLTKEEVKRQNNVNKVIQSKDKEAAKEIRNTKSKDYNPASAIQVLVSPEFRPPENATQQEVDAYFTELNGHNLARGAQIVARFEAAEKSGNDKELRSARAELDSFQESAKRFEAIKRKRDIGGGPTLSDLLGDKKADPKKIIAKFFGSEDNVVDGATIKEANQVLKLSTEEKDRKKIKDFIKFKKAFSSLAKGQDEVSTEIIYGSSKNLGYSNFYQQFTQAVRANTEYTPEVVKQAIKGVSRLVNREQQKVDALGKIIDIIDNKQGKGLDAAVEAMKKDTGLEHRTLAQTKAMYLNINETLNFGKEIKEKMEKDTKLSPTSTFTETAGEPTNGAQAPKGSGETVVSGAELQQQETQLDKDVKEGAKNIVHLKNELRDARKEKDKETVDSLIPEIKAAQNKLIADKAQLKKVSAELQPDLFTQLDPVSPKKASSERKKTGERPSAVALNTESSLREIIDVLVEQDNLPKSLRDQLKGKTNKQINAILSKRENSSTGAAVKKNLLKLVSKDYRASTDVGQVEVPSTLEDANPTNKKPKTAVTPKRTVSEQITRRQEFNNAVMFIKSQSPNKLPAELVARLDAFYANEDAFDLNTLGGPEYSNEYVEAQYDSIMKIKNSLNYNVAESVLKDGSDLYVKTKNEKGNSIIKLGAVIKNYIATLFGSLKQKELLSVIQSLPNFAEQYKNKTKDMQKVLETLTNQERKALAEIMVFEAKFANALLRGNKETAAVLSHTSGEFYREDSPIKMFYKNTPKGETPLPVDQMLDPNFVTAMAVTLYNWIGTRGEETLSYNQTSINRILGRDPDAPVSKEAYDVLANKGPLRSNVEAGLGAEVLKMLGLKALKDGNSTVQEQIKTGMGTVLLATGLQMNLLKEEHVMSIDINALKNKDENSLEDENFTADIGNTTRSENGAFTSFIKIIGINSKESKFGQTQEEASPEVLEIADIVKKSQSMLAKLFDVTKEIEPLIGMVPQLKDIAKVMKNSFGIKISSKTLEIMLKHSQRPHKFKDVIKRINMFSDIELFRLFGGIENVENQQINLQKASRSQNADIKKFIKDMKLFQEKVAQNPTSPGLETEFYFLHEQWKTGRIGMTSGAVNIQQSKLAKHMVGMSAHSVEIPLEGNNHPFLINFKRVVAEGLKIDIVQKDTVIIAELEKKLEEKEFADAIAILKKQHKPNAEALTTEEKIILTVATKKGKMRMQSFEALDSYAAYLVAKENPKKTSFTTELTTEVDGINNGVIIAALQLMLAGSTELANDVLIMLEKGGLFTHSKYDTYTDYKNEPGKNDVYQTLAIAWSKYMNDMNNNEIITSEKYSALKAIIGDITKEGNLESTDTGRTLAKGPVMTFVYGASINTIIENLQETVKDSIYKKIDEALIIKDDVEKAATLNEIKEHLNKITAGTKIELTVKNAQTFEFSKGEINAINIAVNDIYGMPLEIAINHTFEKINYVTEIIKDGTEHVFNMFQAVFELELAAKEKDLGGPLSIEQQEELLAELAEHAPIFRNATAFDDTDLNVGNTYSMKTKTKIDNRKPKSKLVVSGKNQKGINNTKNESMGISAAKSLSTILKVRDYISGNGHTTVKYVQGIDTATMLETLNTNDVINIHDAIVVGLDQRLTATKIMNDNFIKMNEENSLLSDVVITFERTKAAYNSYYNKVVQEYGIDSDEAIKLKDSLTPKNRKGESRRNRDGTPKKVVRIETITGRLKKASKIQKKNLTEFIELVKLNGRSMQYNNGTNNLSQEETTQGELDLANLTEKEEDKLIKEYVQEVNNNAINNAENSLLLEFLHLGGEIDYTTGEFIIPSDQGSRAFEFYHRKSKHHRGKLVNALNRVLKAHSTESGLGSEANTPKNFKPDTDKIFEINKAADSSATTLGIYDLLGQQDNQGNSPENSEHSTYMRGLLERLSVSFTDKVKVLISVENSKKDSKSWGRAGFERISDESTGENKEILVSVGSGAQVNGIQMSSQEVYTHEMIHILTKAAVDGDNQAKRKLESLYEWVRNESGLDWKAFLNDPADASNPTERAAAEARYNYIFNNVRPSVESITNPYTKKTEQVESGNHLHEFIALGLSNQNFRKALSTLQAPKESLGLEGNNLLEKVFNFFKSILSILDERHLRIPSGTVDKQLQVIAQELANLDSKNKETLGAVGKAINAFDNLLANTVVNFVISPLKSYSSSESIRKSKSAVVRGAGGFVYTVTSGEFFRYSKLIKQVRRRTDKTARGFWDSLFREFIGVTADTRVWHEMLALSNKLMDQNHKAVDEEVRKIVLNSFLEFEGKEGQAFKEAITKGFLSTDFTVLDGEYSTDDLVKLLKDPKFLEKLIKAKETELKQNSKNNAFYRYYTRASDSLAQYMITGQAKYENPALNIHNMARLFGTSYQNKINEEQAVKVENILDVITTLKAIQKTDFDTTRTDLATVMQKENDRAADPDLEKRAPGGINFLTQLIKQNKVDSAETLFKDTPALMVKGYTREIYNPNVKYIIAPMSDKSILTKDGYVLVSNEKHSLVTDKDHQLTDKKDMYMWVNRNALATAHQSGISALNQETAAGTDILKINQQQGVKDVDAGYIAGLDIDNLKKLKTKKADALFAVNPPAAVSGNSMVPISNVNGEIVSYRYTMLEETKKEILEKDYSFENIVGKMSANIDDKVNARTINKKVVKELFDEYNRDFDTADEKEFVTISATSRDPQLREIWRMMPTPMKNNVKEIWGKNEIVIRDNIVELVFGRRKFSIADAASQKKAVDKTEQHLGALVAAIVGSKNVKVSEQIWQEIITTVKDIIVVKTGIVLAGNVISNVAILLVAGVPISDIIKNHAIGIKESRLFLKDTQISRKHKIAIQGLESSKDSFVNKNNVINQKIINNKIKKIKADKLIVDTRLANSPVAELNAAGVYQTIVEDIEQETNKYSYKSKIQDWAEPAVSMVPSTIRNGAKHLYMGHDTPIYKFMRDGTQVSDFIARYTLHQHNINNNGMNSRDSIQQIINIFINYDLPTHKYVQYANDMGLIMFTKFAFRIQRVIVETAKGSPSRAVALAVMQNLAGDISDIMDTNMATGPVLERFNFNPWSLITGAAGDVGTIRVLGITA